MLKCFDTYPYFVTHKHFFLSAIKHFPKQTTVNDIVQNAPGGHYYVIIKIISL